MPLGKIPAESPLENSEIASVVGLIMPILSADCSTNQRLPSDPAAIATGLELAVRPVEN